MWDGFARALTQFSLDYYYRMDLARGYLCFFLTSSNLKI